MLRPRYFWHFALAGAAACVAQLVASQSIGLGSKLDAAEKKLDEDIKACRPIKTDEYRDLVIESNRNLKTLLQAAASGAPVDTDTFKADQKRATALFERARAAADKPCPPPQEKPQNAPPPQKNVEPPKDETPILGGQLGQIPRNPFYDFEDEADDAMDDLADAMKKCDADAIKKLIPKLEEMDQKAHEIADLAKAVGKDSKIDPLEAADLAWDLDLAVSAAKKFKCPAKKAEQPKTPTPPAIPPENKKTGVSYEPSDPFARRLLDIQNLERVSLGTQALKWNYQLQLDATAWAQEMARTGQEVHAPREGRGIERENLSKGLIGWNADQMTRSWFNEQRDFVAGIYPNVARDGNWANVSHYSQMIWPTTTDIGCGMATGSGFQWLVCRYSPGGNKPGKPVGYTEMQPVNAPARKPAPERRPGTPERG